MPDYQTFKLPFGDRELIADTIPADSTPDVLIVHGAGSADRFRYRYIREPLAADGVATAAFDHIGHGDTGGELLGSTLAIRSEEALTVIKQLDLRLPLGLVGASMGAYTAIRLTQHVAVDRLVLFVPGIFHRDAYHLPFGPEFSAKIREPKSWEHSDAFEILEVFTGRILIVAAAADTVIPQEIPELLYQSATNASERELFVIPDAPHRIREFLNNLANAALFHAMYQKVLATLKKS